MWERLKRSLKPKNTWQTLPRPPDSARGAKVFTIPASAPFSKVLAKGLLERIGGGPLALADTTIYLPTRRAARGIAEIFAREAGGASLLPEFRPLGDVDEDELQLDASYELGLKPAIAPLRQRLLFATLIRRWSHARDGGTMTFGHAAGLAKSLAAVMDEVEIQGADLAKLSELVPLALADHWLKVKDFLALVNTQWPLLLAAEGSVNPAAHRNEALRALARQLQDNPPDRPVIAAGSTGSMPATGDLLGVIARLPRGAVVLSGLDRELDADNWERLEPGHPQFALKQLLDRIGTRRDDVQDWTNAPSAPQRERLLREVLRPAPMTDAWRTLAEEDIKLNTGVEGLTLVKAADPVEEARLISILLRETLETKNVTAALVTRDRSLARRVAAELGRWKIAIDDSAGRPLPRTAAGSFLGLIAEAADEGFAPVPLLALLKHPFCTLQGEAAAFRARARELDVLLRGPRPDSGLKGIASAIRGAPQGLRSWFAQVAEVLAPLEAALSNPEAALAGIIDAHITAAEKLGATWVGPDGDAANRFMQQLKDSAELIDIETSSYAPLVRTLADEVAVRPPFGRHPRLAILGPLEARLQSFDLVVLGGLNEGSWPVHATDDPWFSRPIRRVLGLEQPERAIGLSAHDFVNLASGPRVVLTRALKAEGTPTVASRWIQRLEQLTKGLKIDDLLEPAPHYGKIAAALCEPGETRPAKPPCPCPPVAARPRKLSVTEIETWVRDPYAIYAKHVLRLTALDPLDAEIGPLERGSALHRALEIFVRRYPRVLPADAVRQLVLIADEVFAEQGIPRATLALWRPRFLRAADWFVEEERARRTRIAESFVEIRGEMIFKGEAGDFTLRGRADRIDRLTAGGAAILDYKTGAPPSNPQVTSHLSPQLSLEGAMLAAGAFKDVGALRPSELVYVRISGGAVPGEFKPVKADAATLAHEAAERLKKRIKLFDHVSTGYQSRTAPFRADAVGDYDHLARVREWSHSGWSGDSE
jgi:ATP-dependent helicase/nuclease subunit B